MTWPYANKFEQLTASRLWRRMRVTIFVRLSSFRSDIAGVALIEFGILSSLLLFMTLAATDLALAVHMKMEIVDAADMGAQYAAVNGWSSSGIISAAQSATSLAVSVSPSTFSGCPTASGVVAAASGATCAAGSTAGTYVSVNVSGSYHPILTGVWNAVLSAGFLNMNANTISRIS